MLFSRDKMLCDLFDMIIKNKQIIKTIIRVVYFKVFRTV